MFPISDDDTTAHPRRHLRSHRAERSVFPGRAQRRGPIHQGLGVYPGTIFRPTRF
jgi:hypothetical protein